MSVTAIFLFCAAFHYCKACGPPDSRVIGGLPAPLNVFPFVVSIQECSGTGLRHFCAGSIIASRWILSAAHCIKDKSENKLLVLVGTINLNSDEGSRYYVKKMYMHPKHNMSQSLHENDIALLLLEESIQFSRSASPIMLGYFPLKGGLPIVAMGWGFTIESGSGVASSLLIYVVLTSMEAEECQRRNELLGVLFNKEILICGWGGGWSGEAKTVCYGDSGGPLIDYKTWRQVGVVSGGTTCSGRFPALFAKVESYWPWIRNVTHSLRKGE